MTKRRSLVERKTTETEIRLDLNIDGTGDSEIETGIPFFDHMLVLFAKHGYFDLTVKAVGDLEVDSHHTVEDVGLCLGQAFREALADKKGIIRYGQALLPMDESLVIVAVDISGRPYLVYKVDLPIENIGNYDTMLTVEFLQAFVTQAGITLHVDLLDGENPHHIIEAVFKGIGRALDEASRIDTRREGLPSTKGVL